MMVLQREIDLRDDDGTRYDRAYVHADPQPGGTWQGFIQFVSADGETSMQTQRETSQMSVFRCFDQGVFKTFDQADGQGRVTPFTYLV